VWVCQEEFAVQVISQGEIAFAIQMVGCQYSKNNSEKMTTRDRIDSKLYVVTRHVQMFSTHVSWECLLSFNTEIDFRGV
jgi:hypothetical protein